MAAPPALQTSAPQLIHEANNAALGINDSSRNGTLTLEKTTGSDATKSDPIPRSQAAPSANQESTAPAPSTNSGSGSDTGIGELTPNAAGGAQAGEDQAPCPLIALDGKRVFAGYRNV